MGKDLEDSVWINPADLASLSSELDNAPINEFDVYVTYTRAELFGLEYLLEKSAKTEIGATNQ